MRSFPYVPVEMTETRIGRRNLIKLGGLGAVASLLSSCEKKPEIKKSDKVKGVVFMVSDGMSQGVLTMAENFSHIVHGKGTRWWELINDPKSTRGLMETSSADSYVTDSAAASSAWGGGMKINNNSVNVRPDGSESTPIHRHLKKLGHRTGLVTTTTITHATPAGFAAVTKNRGDEHLIAPQYLGVVDILLGGGLKFFDAKQRVDSRDWTTPYQKSGYEVLLDRDSFLKSNSQKVLGLFNNGHLPFEVDRLNNADLKSKTPTLAEMSEFALKRFLGGEEKFLLQIEGGKVDHACHANDVAGLLWDQLAFDEALAKVLEMVADRDDILVVVTSDHGNANPGLNGTGKNYTKSNEAFKSITRMTASYENILQTWGKSKTNTAEALAALIEEKLGFKLSAEESAVLYTSVNKGEIIEWSDQLDNPNGLLGQIAGNHTGIGWTGVCHTSDPVMLSAIGPQAKRFSGIVPNQEVYKHFVELLA
ncbi:MAG: alkaline phosphatase [Akkermansiaceae bacterium]|jgi:alkaline phosphatase